MKKEKFVTLEEHMRRSMRNPKFRRAYDDLGPKYALLDILMRSRARKNMTQAELARRAETKQSAIARFESGRYNPSLAFMQKISRALGLRMVITFKKL